MLFEDGCSDMVCASEGKYISLFFLICAHGSSDEDQMLGDGVDYGFLSCLSHCLAGC